MIMRTRVSRVTSTLLFVLFTFASYADATEHLVVPDANLCTAGTATCHSSLSAAIGACSPTGDSIKILPGDYLTNASLSKAIDIFGVETAATFLNGNGGTILTVSGINTGVNISKLTFRNAATAISLSSSSPLGIKSNIFEPNGTTASGIAINITDASIPTIANNTFSRNSTAINVPGAAGANANIFNNVFYRNSLAISSNVSTTAIQNNLFFANSADGPTIDTATQGNIVGSDPRFVKADDADIFKRDFHLTSTVTSTSPCIDKGNSRNGADTVPSGSQADIGAYGGSLADTVPFIVSGVSITSVSSAITVTWASNEAYTVSGYRVYYGRASGSYNGNVAAEGPSPITVPVASGITATTLSSLPSATTPSAPTMPNTDPRSGTLHVTWREVSGATGYKLYFRLATSATDSVMSSATASVVDVKNAIAHDITGLTDYQLYAVGVSAYAQAEYFIAVTAINSNGSYSVGEKNESEYSNEVSLQIGPLQESAISLGKVDYPEPLIPYPNLPNTKQGCFIATAAYGSYAEPHVRILRTFRDTVLLSNSWGHAFVDWYYAASPAAAAWLNEHPTYKPLVRAVLMPVVGMAYCATNYKAGLIVLFILVCLIIAVRNKSRMRNAGMLILLLLAFGFHPSMTYAEDAFSDQTHWSFEIKGGTFTPALSDWATYYGKKHMADFGISLAYKIRRQIEVGVEADYRRASGLATNTGHGTLTGSVTNNFYPVDIFVLFRGVMHEEQWLVPYIGGGFTRIYYNESIEGQDTRKGSASGYHVRGGLQFLLDNLDRDASNNMASEYGVEHTYFFIEAKYTKAKVQSFDLGGTSYLAGFLFEF